MVVISACLKAHTSNAVLCKLRELLAAELGTTMCYTGALLCYFPPPSRKKAGEGKSIGVSPFWLLLSALLQVADFIHISVKCTSSTDSDSQCSAPKLPSSTAAVCCALMHQTHNVIFPICALAACRLFVGLSRYAALEEQASSALPPVVYSFHSSGREQKDLTFLGASGEVTK